MTLAREPLAAAHDEEFGENDGLEEDMILLHVLVGFDPAVQQRIRAAAEGAIVAERLARQAGVPSSPACSACSRCSGAGCG